jgi:hypothetical protein
MIAQHASGLYILQAKFLVEWVKHAHPAAVAPRQAGYAVARRDVRDAPAEGKVLTTIEKGGQSRGVRIKPVDGFSSVEERRPVRPKSQVAPPSLRATAVRNPREIHRSIRLESTGTQLEVQYPEMPPRPKIRVRQIPADIGPRLPARKPKGHLQRMAERTVGPGGKSPVRALRDDVKRIAPHE